MTYSYSGDPSTSDKDAVRFYLHDRGEPWLFTDEEILYELQTEGSVYAAAAELAFVQGNKYTDRRDKTVGPLSIKYGQIADRWYELVEKLRNRGARKNGVQVILTQKSRSPYFRLGQHDNPNAVNAGYELLGSDPRDLTDYGG